VTCSTDEDFTEANASETMKRHFINIHADMTIEAARKYKEPVLDRKGNLVSKRPWKVDLDAIVPTEHKSKVVDRTKEVPLIKTTISEGDVTKV